MGEGKSIDELNIGDSAQISKTITETDINDFARVRVILTRFISTKPMQKKPLLRAGLPMDFSPSGSFPLSLGISFQGMEPSTFPKRSSSLLR